MLSDKCIRIRTPKRTNRKSVIKCSDSQRRSCRSSTANRLASTSGSLSCVPVLSAILALTYRKKVISVAMALAIHRMIRNVKIKAGDLMMRLSGFFRCAITIIQQPLQDLVTLITLDDDLTILNRAARSAMSF